MRIAGGLEACVIDNGVLTITALDPDDVRAHKMFGEASAIGAVMAGEAEECIGNPTQVSINFFLSQLSRRLPRTRLLRAAEIAAERSNSIRANARYAAT